MKFDMFFSSVSFRLQLKFTRVPVVITATWAAEVAAAVVAVEAEVEEAV